MLCRPWKEHVSRLLLLAVCGSVLGCAHETHLRFAEVSYPRLEGERCGSGVSDVQVVVKDQEGQAVGGASAYLLAMSSSDSALSQVTDPEGLARFSVPKGGTFRVVATLLGFHPSSQVVRFDSGCSGSVQLVLKVML